MDSPASRVIIIGSGIGGLSLAQGLKKAGIPFHVFERDHTSDYRAQGYRFRLMGEGVNAVRSLLDDEIFALFEATCAELVQPSGPGSGAPRGLSAHDATQSVQFNPPAGAVQRLKLAKPYTVDRTVFRNVLLTGIDDHITFGKDFKGYTETASGVTAHFSDGTSEDGVLLIGADGCRSSVRRQYLPDQQIVDTEGRCIYGKTPITPELTKLVSEKAMACMNLIIQSEPSLKLLEEPIRFPTLTMDPGFSLPKDYVYWVLIFSKGYNNLADDEILSLPNEETALLSQKLTEKWHPTLRPLLELQDRTQCSALRIYSALPAMEPWTPSARVTLIGDAIHVMPPTGAAGAATALRDSANLSRILAEDGISAASVGKYEEVMRGYAQEAVVQSYNGGKMMFGQKDPALCERVRF